MIPHQAKDEFWAIVEDCLVEIHQLSRSEAQKRIRQLRADIAQPPPDIDADMFYHAEPFDVACDLAQNDLDISQYRGQYGPIVSRHNW
jgi:hypothetical protein